MLGGCEGSASRPAQNILLITIDTLRADRLGCYGFERPITPHIDALAAESLVFDRFYAPLPLTGPTHATLLTGREPWSTGLRYNGIPLPPEEISLAEQLKQAGFATAAFVSGWTLKRNVVGLDRGFDVFDDDFDEIERRAGDTTERALSWLAGERSERWFLWVHFFDPHALYDPPEPYRSRWSVEGRGAVASLYDGEVAYVDAQVGRLMEALEQHGHGDSTLIVVTADHGESLGEHGYFWDHGDLLFEDQVHVPFVIHSPDGSLRGRTDETGRSADLFPTLLGLLGIAAEHPVDGRNLLAEDLPPRVADYFESNQCDHEAQKKTNCWPLGNEGKLHALREGALKLIRHPKQSGVQYQLFDVFADPDERRDLWPGDDESGPALRARLDAWRETLPNTPDHPEIDMDTLRKLQALGYLR